jgi:hypothetical protein
MPGYYPRTREEVHKQLKTEGSYYEQLGVPMEASVADIRAIIKEKLQACTVDAERKKLETIEWVTCRQVPKRRYDRCLQEIYQIDAARAMAEALGRDPDEAEKKVLEVLKWIAEKRRAAVARNAEEKRSLYKVAKEAALRVIKGTSSYESAIASLMKEPCFRKVGLEHVEPFLKAAYEEVLDEAAERKQLKESPAAIREEFLASQERERKQGLVVPIGGLSLSSAAQMSIQPSEVNSAPVNPPCLNKLAITSFKKSLTYSWLSRNSGEKNKKEPLDEPCKNSVSSLPSP